MATGIPLSITLSHLSDKGELDAVEAWAARKSIRLQWIEERLELRTWLTQPHTGEDFYLLADLHNYPLEAPAWLFVGSNWKVSQNKCNWPRRPVKTNRAKSNSTIIHNNPVICAPFNRLAFKQHGGPHENWGAPTNWLNVDSELAKAETIPDMLQTILDDFLQTHGRME